jgi:hypothetical protein
MTHLLRHFPDSNEKGNGDGEGFGKIRNTTLISKRRSEEEDEFEQMEGESKRNTRSEEP